MPIISVEIMKTIDEQQIQKTTKEKQTTTERSKGNRSFSERVRTEWFCWAFKLGFLQLICKASLIFKSSLKLAFSIILKQRDLYESKHVAVECRCLKIWDFLYFLICSSILVFIELFEFRSVWNYFFNNVIVKFSRYCKVFDLRWQPHFLYRVSL